MKGRLKKGRGYKMIVTLGSGGVRRILRAFGGEFASERLRGVHALSTELGRVNERTGYLCPYEMSKRICLEDLSGIPFVVGGCAGEEEGERELSLLDLLEDLMGQEEVERAQIGLFAKQGCAQYVKRLLDKRFDCYLYIPGAKGGTLMLRSSKKSGRVTLLVQEEKEEYRARLVDQMASRGSYLLLDMEDHSLCKKELGQYIGKNESADLRICREIRGVRGSAFDLHMRSGERAESIVIPDKGSLAVCHGAFAYAAGRACGMGEYEIRREFMKMVV